MALIINGESIDEEIIDSEFRQIKAHFERTLQVACCERDPEFRATAKDNITSRALLNQEALKRYPTVEEDDITTRLERLISEAGGEEQFYMNIGVPLKDKSVVRQNVASGVRLDRMLGEVYAPEPQPTDREARAFYDTNLQLFMTEEQVRASHITKSLAGAKSRIEVYQSMRELRVKAQTAGVDFEKLAEENRLEAEQQIDLGWFRRGEFMEEFETIAFSMAEGEISPVFITQLGFHIARVTGRRPPAPKPFEEVKEEVKRRIIDEYRDEKFTEFLVELKKGAKIEDTDPPEGCCPGH